MCLSSGLRFWCEIFCVKCELVVLDGGEVQYEEKGWQAESLTRSPLQHT